MITHLLEPFVCERFKNDTLYRDRHLRVINALPTRKVLGVHLPDLKRIAKEISKNGCEINTPDERRYKCNNGIELIRYFKKERNSCLCYEETLIWGFLINSAKATLDERLSMLDAYIPVLDNWAVCDSFCTDAKWINRSDKEAVWRFIEPWFRSKREFEVRFAIVTAMCYFSDEKWLPKVFRQINSLVFEEIESEYITRKNKTQNAQQGCVPGKAPYYVRMGTAWLLATTLAKHPHKTREFIHTSQLPDDIIRIYVRKARESFRTRSMPALL